MARAKVGADVDTTEMSSVPSEPSTSQHYISRIWAGDLVVIAIFSALSVWLTRGYLGERLFAWGDHPGQFMRVWYPLTHAMPDSGYWLWGVISWNPTWYAGYPEIQFYPPGMTLAGIALHYLTLGQLGPERTYNLIPAIAFVLPLFTCYTFLRYALAPLGRVPSACAGIAAGLLAISLKPMWGGIDGVMIGLMGERLAFGVAPLVLLAGWRFAESPTFTHMGWAAALLAVLLLLHPFHAPAIVLAIVLYAAARVPWRELRHRGELAQHLWQRFGWLANWLLLAVALVAWWMVPLLAHYTPYAAALVRATTDQVITWFDAGRIEWLWLAALMALMLLAHNQPRVTASVGVLAALPPLLVGGILLNDQVLMARFNITVLDPIRFIAEYYLALVLLVGCAVGAITSPFLWRIRWLSALCTVIVIVTLQPYLETAWQDLRSHTAIPSSWQLNHMLEHPAFEGYWDALRDDPRGGRILFASNYLRLPDNGAAVIPTTINSMTPYFTGREIVGGTFSHWSPVARWLWVGDARATLLPAQVESSDGQQLFGKPWDALTDDELVANLIKLNVSTIVVGPNDQQAQARLTSSPHFTPYWHNSTFALFHLASGPETWITAVDADVELVARRPLRWTVQVHTSNPGATLLLKMTEYPLWQAHSNGISIPIHPTPEGLQEIVLPDGAPYQIDITFAPGGWEWSGLLIALAALVVMVAGTIVVKGRRHNAQPGTPRAQ